MNVFDEQTRSLWMDTEVVATALDDNYSELI
jgi:hypothetical protein